MKFKNWVIAQGGSTRLAAKLGLSSMAVQHWLNGTTTPRASSMQKLVKMGKGAFNSDDIINETKKQGVRRDK